MQYDNAVAAQRGFECISISTRYIVQLSVPFVRESTGAVIHMGSYRAVEGEL